MTSRTFIGLMLIVGSILNFGGWAANAEIDNSNVGLTKLSLSIATLGMLILAAGFYGLTDSMSKGPGALYAKIGLSIYLIGTAIAIIEPALIIGSAEAIAKGNQALGDTIDAVQLSIASAGVGIYFLGFAIIGFAIFVEKNINTIIAGLMIVMGMIGAFFSGYDYESELMLPSYLSHAVLPVVAGILFLRSKES
ncbi:uncharacterized protein METZ01_LOCUS312152 [marine metagenome]|uniref:DUF4386 domain-containing protein n=1 Tax=marine metagenome TaxID=408172 RepID=A0A382NFM1_9ZZZZ